MVFNVVVDALVRNWVTVVAPTEAITEGLRETIQELVAFFYVYDRLVSLPWLERLQRTINVCTYIFDWLGLRKNVWKTVIMACRPCYIPGVVLELSCTMEFPKKGEEQ